MLARGASTARGCPARFRCMIDLLSYTAMDLHAARPVAGVARRRGCSASVSRPLPSASGQDPGNHVERMFLVVALGCFRDARPSTLARWLQSPAAGTSQLQPAERRCPSALSRPPGKRWKLAAASVEMGQLCPLAWLASESNVTPGRPNSARRRGARHGARATASPEDSYRACTCARAPFSVSSGSLGASSTPNESSRRAARAHVKDTGHLGLLLRRVQVKVALLRVLLQQASRSPPMGGRGRLFLHGPASCIH